MSRFPSVRFALLLAGLLALPLSGRAEEPDFDALRRLAADNGGHWEVDETFSRSLTPEERLHLRGYAPPPGYQAELEKNLKIFPIDKALPGSVNWRDLGGITPVKNQAQCGSCWAFAATAEMEAFIKIYYGTELDLSEQQVVSCNPYGAGCDGGWATAAYYIFQQRGAVQENCHPYLQADPPMAPCEEADYRKYGWITGYNHIANDVDQIKAALQYGPVCTGIDGGPALEAYGSGCFDVPGSVVNHLVLIVGYDDRACGSNGAWLIKNSWGPDFGEGGYVWVQYGAGLTGNSVTQLEYTAPPVTVTVDPDLGETDLFGDEWTTLTWSTSGPAVPTVDIWLGIDGACADVPVAANVPNTGSYDWLVPNLGTDYGSLVVFPSTGTQDGFGFAANRMRIVGHTTRYVSPAGSDTPPYDTIATAAHSINDAVAACTGTDTVLVAGGDYLGNITLNSTVRVLGSWDPAFTTQDLDAHPTRLQGGNSAVRVYAGAGDFGLLDAFVLHDCTGGSATLPVSGQHGGAIYSQGASPTFSRIRFENNRAASGGGTGFGGAACVVGGVPVFEDCVFTGNVASSGGAVGVFGGATASFTGCDFTANVLSDSLPGNVGGAVYVAGASASFHDSGLVNNGAAGRGGAVYADGGEVVLVDTELRGNRARNGGGGLTVLAGGIETCRVLVAGNGTLSGNGGGLEADGATVALRNTRFTGNTAASIGGGASAFSATGSVGNCQFDGNTGGSVGGLFAMGAGPLDVRRNMAWNNTGGGLIVTGAEAVEDFNNAWLNTGGDNLTATPGAGSFSLDPRFVDAGAGDFGLGLHSPNVDGGAGAADPDGSPADIGLLGGPEAAFSAPPAVTGAALTELGGGAVRLAWDAATAPGVTHYVVYRDTAAVFRPSPDKTAHVIAHPTTTFEETPPAGEWYYLVCALDDRGYAGGYSERVQVGGSGASDVPTGALPRSLAITAVAPNPFNPRTTIAWDLPRSGAVRLSVYDLRGHVVRNLVDGRVEAGSHRTNWDGRDRAGRTVAAGVYFVRLDGAGAGQTRKIVLAK